MHGLQALGATLYRTEEYFKERVVPACTRLKPGQASEPSLEPGLGFCLDQPLGGTAATGDVSDQAEAGSVMQMEDGVGADREH